MRFSSHILRESLQRWRHIKAFQFLRLIFKRRNMTWGRCIIRSFRDVCAAGTHVLWFQTNVPLHTQLPPPGVSLCFYLCPASHSSGEGGHSSSRLHVCTSPSWRHRAPKMKQWKRSRLLLISGKDWPRMSLPTAPPAWSDERLCCLLSMFLTFHVTLSPHLSSPSFITSKWIFIKGLLYARKKE